MLPAPLLARPPPSEQLGVLGHITALPSLKILGLYFGPHSGSISSLWEDGPQLGGPGHSLQQAVLGQEVTAEPLHFADPG